LHDVNIQNLEGEEVLVYDNDTNTWVNRTLEDLGALTEVNFNTENYPQFIGPTGPSGENGAVGPTGATGESGAIGPTGPSGEEGPVGPTGSIGATGPTGSISDLNDVTITNIQSGQTLLYSGTLNK
jgi:hypothetical protein